MGYRTSLEISSTDGDTTANIETLTGEPPFATPIGYPLTVETAHGKTIEHGGQTCEWRFAALTEAQWDALRTVLPTKTTEVWIRTLEPDKFDYGYYTGYCIWPNPEEIQRPTSPKYSTGEFILRFRMLTAYTPTPP